MIPERNHWVLDLAMPKITRSKKRGSHQGTAGAAFLAATLIMGLFSFLFGCSKRPPSADEWALAQLRQGGDDLSKPHKLEFQLRFPTQSAAEQVATRIKAAGFDVTEKSDGQDGGWLCVATNRMIPELAALAKIHGDFDGIAAQFGGTYEGWGMAAESQK